MTELEQYRPTAPALYEPGPNQVPQLIAGWLLAQRSPHTADAYRRDIAMWLAWLAQWETPPLEVRRSHADSWARWMENAPHGRNNKPASKATVNRRLACISSFYDYCVDEEVIDVNRVRRTKRHRVNKRHSTTFRPSPEETVRILAQARADGPRSHALVVLLTFSGARVSEVLGAQIEDFGTDMGERFMRVTRKGGEPDDLPLKPAELVGGAVDAYLAYRAELAGVRARDLTGPVFLDRGGRTLTRQAAANLVGRIGTAAGCPLLTPHSLRHAFATIGKMAGAEKDDLQEALGHASGTTTERYIGRLKRYDRHPGQLIADFLGVA